MRLEALNPERVEAIFLQHGAHSVTFSDAGDRPVLEPAPGETPLWNDTRITGLFGPDADLEAVAEDLRRSLGIEELPEHSFESLENRRHRLSRARWRVARHVDVRLFRGRRG